MLKEPKVYSAWLHLLYHTVAYTVQLYQSAAQPIVMNSGIHGMTADVIFVAGFCIHCSRCTGDCNFLVFVCQSHWTL